VGSTNKDFVLVSAGGVLFRKRDSEIEVCLISKRDRNVWALPRGRVEEGETPDQTAVREVREETGFQAKVLRKIDEISFHFYSKTDDRLIYRTVHFFLMPLENSEQGIVDSEVGRVEWFPIEQAIRVLKYENEKEILRKARNLLRDFNWDKFGKD
jgi:8-oxo-dGTP pyrophosphatase MutT (NUDIX family)